MKFAVHTIVLLPCVFIKAMPTHGQFSKDTCIHLLKESF